VLNVSEVSKPRSLVYRKSNKGNRGRKVGLKIAECEQAFWRSHNVLNGWKGPLMAREL